MFLYGFSSSHRKRNEFDFDNFYKLHFSKKKKEKKKNKIIMTVFILIKHYTRSTRMNWLELSRLCINALPVFALFP